MFNFCRNQTEKNYNNNNVAEQFVLGVILGKVGICLYLFTFHLNQESSISRKYFTGVFSLPFSRCCTEESWYAIHL